MQYINHNEFVTTEATCPECGGLVRAAYADSGIVLDCERDAKNENAGLHLYDAVEWLPVMRAVTLYMLKNYRLTISK